MSTARLAATSFDLEGDVDLDRALDVGGEAFVWDERAVAGEGGEWFIALGSALRIDAEGDGRFERVRRAAAEVFGALEVRSGARPRLVGSFAFEPGACDGAWQGFGDASFFLPRLMIARHEDRFRATFVGDPSEVDAVDESPEARRRLLSDALGQVRESGRPAADDRAPDSGVRVQAHPMAAFVERVGGAISAIRRGVADKIVVSARTRIEGVSSSDSGAVLRRLAGRSSSVRFAFKRGDSVFLGASPERLVSVEDRMAKIDALAGSMPRTGDDERVKVALLGSDKDLREHAWVVPAIRDAIGPRAVEMVVPPSPVVRTLQHVHHLATPISAKLREASHVVDLVEALHPTPAMAGWPRAAAVEALRAIEGVGRGLYASPIGWFDGAGEGSFAVAIRSALLDADGAWVFAGAGIVDGSDPEAEWAETRAKAHQMLEALGVS